MRFSFALIQYSLFGWSMALPPFATKTDYFPGELFDSDAVNVRLTTALIKRHTLKTRPVTHPHDGLKVNLICALYQIVDMDQRSNLATISAFFDLWWQDKFLAWNASEYNGTTKTYLPAETVWIPDLYLYHSVQGSTPLTVQQSAVQLTYDGTVRIFIPFTARALCMINVKYFPFDQQNCEFVFGSWSYRMENVEYIVASPEVLLEDFYDNQEWVLLNSTLHKTISQYYNETYSTVTLHVVLRRQSFYYVFNLVLPVTLVAMVSVIGFHVPANASERRESKFRLGIMTLLSMGVLLLNVVNDMPKFSMTSEPGKRGSFSDVPLLGLFYVALIVIISVGTMSTGIFVWMEKYALHHPDRIPYMLRILDFDWPDCERIWRRFRSFSKRDKKNRGCFIEQEETEMADQRIPNPKSSLALNLKSIESEEASIDDDASTRANCLSNTVVGLKNGASSPGIISCIQNNNHSDFANTPPSYRCAILSASRKQVPTTKMDAVDLVDSCTNDPDVRVNGLAKICADVLSEIKAIRELYEKRLEAASAPKSKSDPHRTSSSLTRNWSRVIHRFEALSLIMYLWLVVTALIMFFSHGWY